jgi:hypothetical protein
MGVAVRPLLAAAQPGPGGWNALLAKAGIRFQTKPDSKPELL